MKNKTKTVNLDGLITYHVRYASCELYSITGRHYLHYQLEGGNFKCFKLTDEDLNYLKMGLKLVSNPLTAAKFLISLGEKDIFKKA